MSGFAEESDLSAGQRWEAALDPTERVQEQEVNGGPSIGVCGITDVVFT